MKQLIRKLLSEITNNNEQIYIYHGTSKGAANNIKKDGYIKTNNVGEIKPSTSFTNDIDYAKYYAMSKGGKDRMVILRTILTDDFELSNRIKNNKGDEYITFENVPVNKLEIKTKYGWIPLIKWDVIFDELITENTLYNDVFKFKNDLYINDLKKELSKYETSEQLLRSGGLSIELLDRLAHGFSEEDIKTLKPKELKLKWLADLENVVYEIEKSGLSPEEWAKKINLSEPIDVSFLKIKNKTPGFYIEDGHHRYMAAKILNKELPINLEIKINPIVTISPDLSYDEFHRKIFDTFSN